MLVRLRELGLVTAVAAVVTVLLTWPIAARFGTAGRIDSADGQFSVWNVAWVAHALSTDPRSLFDANIFYPHHEALAFSEANLVAGVIALPAWLLTHNAVAAMNWVILCSFVMAACSMYLLVRHLTASRGAGAVAGLLYGFSPYAFAHLPQVQLLMTFGPPLTLLMLHRFVDRPGIGRALALSAALAISALACGYYGIFGGLTVALGFVWLGATGGRLRDPAYWALGGLSAVVAVAIVVPFLAPYLSLHDAGFARSLDEARQYSIHWEGYFASAVWVHQWMLPLLGQWREVLFPKFLTIALALVAAVIAARRCARHEAITRSALGFYLALAAVALWASLGPKAGLYSVLYWAVPMFDLLRAPSRFGLIVIFGLAVAAGIGFADIERRLRLTSRRVFVAVACVVALTESVAAPLTLKDVPRQPPVYGFLKFLPWGPVAEYPFYAERATDYQQTWYMLMSTSHWKPLINGYSDYTPDDYRRRLPAISSFPSAEGWAALKRSGARYVVMHWARYSLAERVRLMLETAKLRPGLRPIIQNNDVSLFEIASPKWVASGHF